MEVDRDQGVLMKMGDPFKVGEALLRVEVVASAPLHGLWVSPARFSGEIYKHTLSIFPCIIEGSPLHP